MPQQSLKGYWRWLLIGAMLPGIFVGQMDNPLQHRVPRYMVRYNQGGLSQSCSSGRKISKRSGMNWKSSPRSRRSWIRNSQWKARSTGMERSTPTGSS